jgi:hypothetical protein
MNTLNKLNKNITSLKVVAVLTWALSTAFLSIIPVLVAYYANGLIIKALMVGAIAFFSASMALLINKKYEEELKVLCDIAARELYVDELLNTAK